MPVRLRQFVPDLVDLGVGITNDVLSRRNAGLAGNQLTAGVDSAGRRISTATGTAVANEQDALNRQDALYRERRRAFQPNMDAGTEGTTALRSLVNENPQFDASKVGDETGYAFGRDEGLKEVQRILSSRGTLNSGQVKGLIRYANDYATTKVNDSFNRFTTGQNQRLDRINALTGVGERATAGGDSAAADFGDQIGRNATNRSALALSEADALGNLDISRANVQAGTTEARSDATGRILDTAGSVGAGLLKKALGLGGTVAAPAGAVGTGAATGGAAAASTEAAASTAATGSLGKSLMMLAKDPITLGIAGAIAAGAIWLKSQAHWEANTAVKDFENPFHANSLAPFAAQWEKAIKGGQVTAQQGHASLDQYIQNFEDYTNRIEQWAGTSKDKMKVAAQSIANLYKTTVQPQISRMQGEIAQLPA